MKKENNSSWVTLLFGAIISIGVIVIILWITYSFLKDDTQRGTFGDMFGVANALFSGLAFSAIIITIILQMREVKFTRMEYSRSSKALEESSKRLKEQLETTILNQKIISQNDLIKDLFNDSESRKFYYDIDYGKFVFKDEKNFLEKFKGSDDERRLDSLLYKYNYVGRLVNTGYLDINDIDFLVFPMLQVFNNENVQNYLEWLDKENVRWGNENFRRHGDYRWLMEEAIKRIN